jgi:hypothetical protein
MCKSLPGHRMCCHQGMHVFVKQHVCSRWSAGPGHVLQCACSHTGREEQVHGQSCMVLQTLIAHGRGL